MRRILGLTGFALVLSVALPLVAQQPAPSGSALPPGWPPGTPPPTPGAPPPVGSAAPAPYPSGSGSASTPPAPPGQPPAPESPPGTTEPGQPYGQGAPPAGPPAQPYGQPVSAGGLDAPPPVDPDAEQPQDKGETEKDLDEAEEEDSGRGLTWFWIDVEGGYQYAGLETFNVEEDEGTLTVGFEQSDAHGGYVGAGIGAQIIIFRIGPRFRVGFFDQWQLYSIDGELGFRIPLGPVEPHVELAAGYSALGSIGGLLEGSPDAVDIDGFNVRVGGGIDIFPGTKYFSLGAVFTWEFMGMTRPGVDPQTIADLQSTGQADQAQAELLAAEGSGYGTALSIGGRLGLHF